MESNKIQSALEYWHSRLSQECGEDHIDAGIYEDILPADVARYQVATLYKPYKES